MVSQRAAYAPVNIHAEANLDTWPAVIPPMSESDAINATKRLYRWATGRTFAKKIVITSGNRRAFRIGFGIYYVNPSRGWREFAHLCGHWYFWLKTGDLGHSKAHARFEKNMVAQIVRRGWLNPAPPAVEEPTPINAPGASQRLKLQRIDARIMKWETKAKRAKNALAKLARQKKYYERALAKVTA